MADDDLSAVRPAHAAMFGFVITLFAQIESLMTMCAAGILQVDFGAAMILMGELRYQKKRQTLLLLNTTIGVNGWNDSTLISILDEIDKFSTLRNSIAHSLRTKGPRPGSIKPMKLLLRGKVPKPIGRSPDEKSYPAAELKADVRKLADLVRRFNQFLEDSGLNDVLRAKLEEAGKASQERNPPRPRTFIRPYPDEG